MQYYFILNVDDLLDEKGILNDEDNFLLIEKNFKEIFDKMDQLNIKFQTDIIHIINTVEIEDRANAINIKVEGFIKEVSSNFRKTRLICNNKTFKITSD